MWLINMKPEERKNTVFLKIWIFGKQWKVLIIRMRYSDVPATKPNIT